MSAVSRFAHMLAAAALAALPVGLLAQEAPPPASSQPATPPADAVGPRELENFRLPGTVTRPAEQPAATTPPAERPRADPPASPAPQPAPAPTRSQGLEQHSVAPTPAPPAPAASDDASQPPGASMLDLGDTPAAPDPSVFAPAPPAPAPLAPERDFPLWPWLAAALAIGAGAFLLWRNRSRQREALADGTNADFFAAPEAAPPEPVAKPAPPPPPPVRSPSAGIVSTRLRPWIEVGFQPTRCVLDEQQLTVEFEIELFNSGSAPARSVLPEAKLFNAGAAQEQELARFFANSAGAGDRSLVIAPLDRLAFESRIVIPRQQLETYDIGGQQAFVPVIGLTVLYGWGGGEGQTSASYLLGRDTGSNKLGPFRMHAAGRIFRGVAARLLPAGVRR